MTDDTTPTPMGEEPADPKSMEIQKSEVERQPTEQLPPGMTEEPTLITDRPDGDAFATVTMATLVNEEATPLVEKLPTAQLPPSPADADMTQVTPAEGFVVAPTVQAASQPSQAYEHFDAEAAPAIPYAGAAPAPATPFNAETPTGVSTPLYTDPYAYMQYPAQPGMPIPPAAGRHNPLLWVVLVVVLVLLVGGGVTFALIANRAPTNTPTQVLQQFCDGFKTYDAQKIYNTFSAAQQAKTSVADIQQSLDQLKDLSSFAKITACTVSDVHQNGSTASGTVTITETISLLGTSTSMPIPMSLTLILENNAWKIDNAVTPNSPLPTVPAIPTVTG
jgi:hypothetical protein